MSCSLLQNITLSSSGDIVVIYHGITCYAYSFDFLLKIYVSVTRQQHSPTANMIWRVNMTLRYIYQSITKFYHSWYYHFYQATVNNSFTVTGYFSVKLNFSDRSFQSSTSFYDLLCQYHEYDRWFEICRTRKKGKMLCTLCTPILGTPNSMKNPIHTELYRLF